MRRSRPEDYGPKRPSSPQGLRNPSVPPAVDSGVVLEWALSPVCCVCREAYVPSPEKSVEGVSTAAVAAAAAAASASASAAGGGSSSSPRRLGGGHGGVGGADESFVVLPDSTPVLSESYFSLPRPGTASSESGGLAGGAPHTSHELSYTERARIGSRISSGPGGNSSMIGATVGPGSELLESGFGSGFGVWTGGSVFGVGSSMLESIVQISHAGLSDNVKRESLLHDLARHPSRRDVGGVELEEGATRDEGAGVRADSSSEGSSSAGKNAGVVASRVASGDGNDDGGDDDGDDDADPTLCCHCYASLLERIDEDSRLADGEALAYRDFVALLDGIVAAGCLDEHDNSTALTTNSGSAAENSTNKEEENKQLKLARRTAATLSMTATSSDIASFGKEEAGSDVARRKSARHEASFTSASATRDAASPFAKALRLAQQTSMQLRTELRSLETQREALCVRGSNAWAALSELAYARGVLGDECRELMRVSREVAEAASDLSERSALSDLFLIRHVDGFPSINGYRLGRVPDDRRRLNWNEINAAWGEAVLLVRCVSNAVDFHSRRFRLVPLNCISRIVELASGGDVADRGGEVSSLENQPLVCAHDLFSSGGGKGDDKNRLLAAVRAFLACSSEVIAHVEKRVLERRSGMQKGFPGGAAGSVSASAGVVDLAGPPYRQTEDAVGGVLITSLKSQASWKAWLCQLVKNLEWAVGAGSSLCVT